MKLPIVRKRSRPTESSALEHLQSQGSSDHGLSQLVDLLDAEDPRANSISGVSLEASPPKQAQKFAPVNDCLDRLCAEFRVTAPVAAYALWNAEGRESDARRLLKQQIGMTNVQPLLPPCTKSEM